MSADHRPPRLLAVSHEASQTGAPIVLVTLLEWMRRRADVSIHSLLVEDGPLRARFEAVGHVSAISDRRAADALSLIERGLVARGHLRSRRIPATLRYRSTLARLGRFDLVYLNSLTTLDVLPHLPGSPKVIAHIHEGPVTLAEWRRTRGPLPPTHRPHRWIAVNDETGAAISTSLGVDPADVEVHHPFIDVAAARAAPPAAAEAGALRRALGIPPGAAVVVGSGSIDRRKGPDLFVQLAIEVRNARGPGERPVHFVWVGGDLSGADGALLRADIERSGAQHVHVTGHVADPRPHFRLADAFALTSREDPFPLVCLEHAALGVPVVAYATSGIRTFLVGAGPLAADGVIPYLDVTSMARRVTDLLDSPTLADEAGAQLSAAVESHHDVGPAALALAASLGLALRPHAGG